VFKDGVDNLLRLSRLDKEAGFAAIQHL
jgi:hypothetical protein